MVRAMAASPLHGNLRTLRATTACLRRRRTQAVSQPPAHIPALMKRFGSIVGWHTCFPRTLVVPPVQFRWGAQ